MRECIWTRRKEMVGAAGAEKRSNTRSNASSNRHQNKTKQLQRKENNEKECTWTMHLEANKHGPHAQAKCVVDDEQLAAKAKPGAAKHHPTRANTHSPATFLFRTTTSKLWRNDEQHYKLSHSALSSFVIFPSRLAAITNASPIVCHRVTRKPQHVVERTQAD